MSKSRDIDDLRAILFNAIDAVQSGNLDLEKARMVSDLSRDLIACAKVEVAHEKATLKDSGSGFFVERKEDLPTGITGTIVHKLR